MKREHRVKIFVSDTEEGKHEIMRCRYRHFPDRLLKLLFGEMCEVLILAPGKSVQGVLVQEVKKKEENDDKQQSKDPNATAKDQGSGKTAE